MDEMPVTADVVVACLFAGVGAWAAKVEVGPVHTYASELFGSGHAAIKYPEGMEPVVTLTIPANTAAVEDNDTTEDVDESKPQVTHNGSAEVTFTLGAGSFMSDITGLMWDPNLDDEVDSVPAPGTVASIVSGGRAGQNMIVIKVEEADTSSNTTGGRRAGAVPGVPQTISFRLPRLQGLSGALSGAYANSTDPKKVVKSAKIHTRSRIISGEFTDAPLSSAGPNPRAAGEDVVQSRDSLTMSISDSNSRTIVIDGDSAFMAVKEAHPVSGYVHLADITIRTQQLKADGASAKAAKVVYMLQQGTAIDPGDPDSPQEDDLSIYERAMGKADPTYYDDLLDLDGDRIDEGLRGNFAVTASGTRGLFNDGDMLFVDYDGNGKMGDGEEITIDGDMGVSKDLAIDPNAGPFNTAGTGTFKVYYMVGGKDAINHGSMIRLTGTVDYSHPTTINEKPANAATTLMFEGVGNPVMAYAIPHSSNGIGDKGNVRVRCEAPAPGAMACRVFLECWDDMGMRGFGEAPMIAGDSVMVWSGEAIEGVTGMEPTSRHSCRVLSKGMVTVQQLTRDGNSGTLVNNTYVGGSM